MVGAMLGHQGCATSKLSCDLYHINVQLRSGKTRKGEALDEIPGEREKLEEEKLAILVKMQEGTTAMMSAWAPSRIILQR